MKQTVHRAETRGHANHGWLDAHHSFSFGSWFNPDRIQFGALRVLNDDVIAPGAGFPTHPHDNMEIITIPLRGVLEHQDSMGNKAQIKAGEVQVMSAGTGVTHSEYNASATEELKLFQIWLFPNQRDVKPRYDEIKLDPIQRKNKFQQILSPSKDDDGVWIYQEAWMHMALVDQSRSISYDLKRPNHGIYIIVIEGMCSLLDELLYKRDAIAIEGYDKIKVQAIEECELLLIEVPL
jgi:redox-sensitive bicupin YhaK (pirin superfamily)